ncbi:MAG: hypothetical protein COZ27_01220 [Candidatus Moranbacteria bacterium CG_4_10_14_3_um_filter_41_65]|nr:MAG: hypothetical protein COX32_00480 [Candidatus Moranbacteria bacterium CG23_combo_of_CG06-09_8_20_14_all_41_28]PIW94242.1 MAG: hypothetical protein COZ86_02145 [Candidatus Moranbacteria bacterium CG_4_8_14_3_um_filter_41_13]PIX91750.1 MAG: hypothetical protein COZ27_01220 [Candidatus Moranbacteria bacterium CG_4_10_14_3_um_filter_41_65]
MKIALVAPAFGQTGGPEVMVKTLAESLTKKGVDITVFAPADWKTTAKHMHSIPQSLWNMTGFKDQTMTLRRNFQMASQTTVLKFQDTFDLIHLNVPSFAAAAIAGAKIPVLLSAHSRIPKDEFLQLKKLGAHIVALSHAQAKKLPYDSVIWNGLNVSEIQPSFEPGKYLVTIGRLTDQKGIHSAINIAKKARVPLIIIGRVGNGADRQVYFKEQIKPYIDGDMVRHLDTIPHEEIFSYLRSAKALLFPIVRAETFGLVAAEALACGTPVIGTRVDPLPELLTDSSISFLSDDLDELANVAAHTERFDRQTCRRYAEEHFSTERMADEYIALYKDLLK